MDEDQRFKVTVLLQEYDTLRAEILVRTQQRSLLLGVAATLLAIAAANYRELPPDWWIWKMSLPVTVIAIWWWLSVLLADCALRVREIEQEVNTRCGEVLLRWESAIAAKRLFWRKVTRTRR
jgi:hypothetical protein